MNRPCLLIGNGIRGNPALLNDLLDSGIPCLVTWQFIDGVPEDAPAFCGRPGVVGQRAANIIIQKCDWLMAVGARLDMETVGQNLENFGRRARKIVVDVDRAELNKLPNTWEKICVDLDRAEGLRLARPNPEWLAECKAIYNHFRPELDGGKEGEYEQGYVNPYDFIREISRVSLPGEVLVPGSSGMQSCAFLQAFKVKAQQRILVCNTIGAMGMEAMAIGAAIASGRRVIVITGDGGFALNIQELEVIHRLKLPIHFFVFSNGGYGSISVMQDSRFGLRVGCTPKSGLTLPDLEKVASVWDMPYFEMYDSRQFPYIEKAIQNSTATLTSVQSTLEFRYACRVASQMVDGVLVADDMCDMTPKLNPVELAGILE